MVWISGGETQRDGLDKVARETHVRTAGCQRTHIICFCAFAPLSMCWVTCGHLYRCTIWKMTQRNHVCILIPKLVLVAPENRKHPWSLKAGEGPLSFLLVLLHVIKDSAGPTDVTDRIKGRLHRRLRPSWRSSAPAPLQPEMSLSLFFFMLTNNIQHNL